MYMYMCIMIILYMFTVHRSTGFMLEGFPTQSDELRYVCSKGLFPDTVAVLEVTLHVLYM